MARSRRPELEKDNPAAPLPYRRRRTLAHATVTIRGAAKMTPWRRQEIARWLRRQADFLQAEGTNMSAQFIARFLTR